jgi:predicted Ser/Thr protein kinase
VPEVLSCPQCSSAIPAAAPAGLCPTCLLKLPLVPAEPDAAPRPPDPDSTGDHVPAESTHATTADVSQNPDPTGSPDRPRDSIRRPARPQPPAAPRTLGNLDIFEELGRGGMGVVYRGRQKFANREVAVKVIADNLAARPDVAERFAAEIEVLAGLKHPNIVQIYEVGEDAGCLYYAMELLPGGSLAGEGKQQLAPAEAAAIVQQLADAVHAAHEAGVIHRDIKPGNVLLAADGSPKLSDFGLVKWLDQDEGMTETGAVLGTPSYMAPEQAAGSKHGALGPHTDVYGLGATLYKLLTGVVPFRGENTFETVKRVLNEQPVPPRRLRPEIHRDLEAVCLKCLEKDPARRYATAEALADDLRRWRMGDPTRARPVGWRRRLWLAVRRRARLVAALAVVGAAVAAGAFIATKSPPSADAAMRKLRRGEAVTLIGETGAPHFHRWIVGVGEVNQPRQGDLFMVSCAATGMMELVPDTQTNHYRFSAEYLYDRSVGANAEMASWVGVYFAHQPDALGPGRVADRMIVVEFSDHESLMRRYDKLTKTWHDHVGVRDSLVLPEPAGGFRVMSSPIGSLRVESPGASATDPRVRARPRAWRKIVAIVGPEEIDVRWYEPDGTYRPVALKHRPTIPTGGLDAPDRGIRGDLRLNRPEIDPDQLVRFRPRGGVGVYLRDARVFFRNVVLEPLPPQSAP